MITRVLLSAASRIDGLQLLTRALSGGLWGTEGGAHYLGRVVVAFAYNVEKAKNPSAESPAFCFYVDSAGALKFLFLEKNAEVNLGLKTRMTVIVAQNQE